MYISTLSAEKTTELVHMFDIQTRYSRQWNPIVYTAEQTLTLTQPQDTVLILQGRPSAAGALAVTDTLKNVI